MTSTKPKDDTRAIQIMRAEAERRKWLLWPSRKQRRCAQHGYEAVDMTEPCPECFREAMAWQLTLKKDPVLVKIPDVERSEYLASQLDHYTEIHKKKRTERSIAARAASVRVGKEANRKAECKPRMAKASELRVWKE